MNKELSSTNDLNLVFAELRNLRDQIVLLEERSREDHDLISKLKADRDMSLAELERLELDNFKPRAHTEDELLYMKALRMCAPEYSNAEVWIWKDNSGRVSISKVPGRKIIRTTLDRVKSRISKCREAMQ